ncbi:MAG TPA: hypothetical protein VIP09_14665 [Dehalococcoidia bacterium]|jgi:hypothetical protein
MVYAEMASSVIKDARDFCGGYEPFIAALRPLVGTISNRTIHGWIEGRHGVRSDALLAAASIADIDLTERLGAIMGSQRGVRVIH